MSLFDRLFGKRVPLIQCPRCLGKGHVDIDDIKGLKKELKWQPGSCAYCEGRGKVKPEMLNKVAVDETYLTTDLSREERQRLIDRDAEALGRGRIFEEETIRFIREINFLHSIGKLDPEKIAEFYLKARFTEEWDKQFYEQKNKELIDYINRVIALNNSNSQLN